jgi:hypothetical protein
VGLAPGEPKGSIETLEMSLVAALVGMALEPHEYGFDSSFESGEWSEQEWLVRLELGHHVDDPDPYPRTVCARALVRVRVVFW